MQTNKLELFYKKGLFSYFSKYAEYLKYTYTLYVVIEISLDNYLKIKCVWCKSEKTNFYLGKKILQNTSENQTRMLALLN